MFLQSLRDPLRQLVGEADLGDLVNLDEIEAGLAHLEAEVGRIAMDAYTALAKGTRLGDAVLDFENYPYLARFHAYMDDILTLSLPPELEQWLRKLVAMPEPPAFESMRCKLVATAAEPANPYLQALARFVLFEGVRLNLVLGVHSHREETMGVGLQLGELDEIAEQHVDTWLAEGPAVPEDTRPFHIIVAAAVEKLAERSNELHEEMRSVKRDVVEAISRRCQIEAALAEMDTVDALLVRNAIGPALGEQRLKVEHLQQRHIVLEDYKREALDQRLKRAKEKGDAGLRRRRVALVDLLLENNGSKTAALES